MIKSIRHIGIQVKNMKESLDFWEAQGFERFYDAHEIWKGQKLHVVKLTLAKSPGGMFKRPDIELVDGDWPNHIAFTVDKLPFAPRNVHKTPSGHRVLFIQSPEGTRIELVEEPEIDNTPTNTVHHR